MKKLLLLGLVISSHSCSKTEFDGYTYFGKFNDRKDAQNKIVRYLYASYNRLNETEYTKLHFRVIDNLDGKINKAIWYNKNSKQLGIENDYGSGMSCTWDEVDRTVLEKLLNLNQGLAPLDSLAKAAININNHASCY